MPDATVRFANLRAGQLDMIERIAPTDLESLRKSPKLASAAITGLGYQGITFNVANGARADSPAARRPRAGRTQPPRCAQTPSPTTEPD